MASHVNPVNWFEIPMTDVARAKKFYETITELELAENQMGENTMLWFPMEMGVPGATGSLVKGEGITPSHDGTTVYFNVDSIDSTQEKIEAAGGKNLTPKIDIGEFGFFAHFEDSEGNKIAIHESPSEETQN